MCVGYSNDNDLVRIHAIDDIVAVHSDAYCTHTVATQ